MPKIESTKQAPPDPAQLVQTAPTPSGSASVASTSADSAVPSAQLGGLSIRPRLLGRASTANPSAASSSNAKNVRAALFAAQSVSQGPDPAEVLVKASSRLKRFNDLAQKVVPTEPSDIKALEARLRSGTSALESARQAFQALAELNIKKRIPVDNIEEHENFLVPQFAIAASLHFGACQKMIDQKMATELGHVPTQRVEMVTLSVDATRLQQPESWLALRAHILNSLAALEEVCQRIRSPMTGQGPRDSLKANLPVVRAMIASCHERMQTVRGMLVEIYSRRLSDQATDCGLLQVLDRLRELEEIDSLNHAAVGEALNHVIQVHIERLSSTEHSLTPEALALCKRLLVEYAEVRGRAGMQLCVDAAALIEQGEHARDHLWPTMLHLAQALADQRQAILDMCEFAVQDRQLIGTAAASPEQAPASITPSVPTTTAGKSSRSRKARMRTSDASSSAAPAQRVIDERNAAQKQADEILKSTRLESLPVAELGGDFIALAKRLGKDTTDIERLIGDSRRDAATAFDFARTSMQDWFGSSERLLQLKSKLRAGDPRIAQLDTRLRLLQRIEQEFERREADALKTDPQPRAPHLQRLLAMHALARVTAPNRLPSEDDRGDRGRLFEVRIDHTPQSNGDIPAPWFVHVHTEKPVTSTGLRALHYKDLAAVHLKTAREVNLGARWEEMMRALGNTEAKVHRATIGSKLMGQLWAAGAGGQQ
ncbi:outer protein P [Xanthomonas oryzae pv. oryzae]|uniref:type III secretion system effector XopP n=1 Tax=Xanthomonas oryzae TaxID=347 RepID=UPI0005A669DA|nr:type III secretion system effector XopP [Xanthomonas oryzae]AOS03449.1 outer protein P [Xanthomonas oryzae pv. oryzae]AOS20087.1 outer protein P [Xanthomonas oryzae pv. oryzae]AOS28406.1 outer protein P [Xanthomonas oryzae pv. oryzae]AOS32545.1 outer protein P [Xanthomonas oryzae pv. oryzae]AQU46394.1 outer protein P [Xanthomonas oryzae pv. oryzae]